MAAGRPAEQAAAGARRAAVGTGLAAVEARHATVRNRPTTFRNTGVSNEVSPGSQTGDVGSLRSAGIIMSASVCQYTEIECQGRARGVHALRVTPTTFLALSYVLPPHDMQPVRYTPCTEVVYPSH